MHHCTKIGLIYKIFDDKKNEITASTNQDKISTGKLQNMNVDVIFRLSISSDERSALLHQGKDTDLFIASHATYF